MERAFQARKQQVYILLKRLGKLEELNGGKCGWNILRDEERCLNEKGEAEHANPYGAKEVIWIIT